MDFCWSTVSCIVPYILLLCYEVGASTVYFDKYGHCSRNSDPYFKVDGDTYTVLAQGGEPYKTLVCILTFKTVDDTLCLKFKNYKIVDCEVELSIYDGNSDTGEPTRFNCYTKSKSWCSTGNYLTLKLKKSRLNLHNYDFEIEIKEKGRSNVLEGSLDTFVVSIGVIVVIIVAVVAVIAVLAILVVCCCCKPSKHYGRVYRNPNKKPKSGTSEPHTTNIEPSAPPIQQHEMQSFPVNEDSGSAGAQGQRYEALPGEQPPAYYPTLPPYHESDPSEKMPLT